MKFLSAVLGQKWVYSVAWVLLHSLWQAALIGAAFALVRLLLRRCSANARYVAGCLALALLFAAPAATFFLTSPTALRHLEPGFSSGPSGSNATLPIFTFANSELGDANAMNSLFQSSAKFLGVLAPWLVVVWVLGVIFFSFRLTHGYWQVRTIRLGANEPVDCLWMEKLNDLRDRLGVTRPVRLLKSALVEVPTVIGWFRPLILLPAASLSGLTPSQLEAILAHELAHVRRLDYVVNACQCLIETLMFYHPAVWWISRCIREERENCCDDLVIKVCADRLDYAQALAALEEFRAELPKLAFAASGGSLLDRIRRLLGVADNQGRIGARQVCGLSLLGLGLLLIVLGLCLFLSPANYAAGARVKVERDLSAQPGFNDGRTSLTAYYDPYFMQTEFEVIQSELVLNRVIDSLNLREEWGKKYAGGEKLKTAEAISLLRGRIALRPIRSTSLIEILVFGDKPEEAAVIANAIAEAYRSYRLEQRVHMAASGLKALEERFIEQEKKAHQVQDDVDRLRAELRIPDAVANEAAPSGVMMNTATLQKLEALRIENKTQIAREESLLNRLKELSMEQLTRALPTAAPDSLLISLLEQSYLAEQRLVSIQKDFGPEHSEVVKVSSQLKDLQSKIKNRIEGILLGLGARLSSLKEGLKNLDGEVESAVQQDISQAEKNRPYFVKKRELEEIQRFRQILYMKIASEQTDLALPKTALVEIVDRAAPSRHPVSPNRPRATALIVLGLMMDICGLGMLKRSRKTASPPA